MYKSVKSILLLCGCLWCAEVQAQPVRTVFVAKEPYKQLSLYIAPSSIDIFLNGRVKSVEQTSNVYLVHVLSGGGMTSVSYQEGHYLQYIFDSFGNLESYKSKYITFNTNTVEASVEQALPATYFRQPTEQYTIEDDKSYFFKDGLLTKEKEGSTTNLYEYDDHDNLICIKEYHGNFWPRTTTVSLNENGLPLTVTVHDPSNTHNQQEKDKENIPDNATDMLCYDAEGNCTAHLQKCYNGWRMDVYEYDRSGNLIFEGACEKYSKSNPCGCKKSRINHGYEYDSQNNRIRDYLIGDWKPSKWDRSFKYDTAGREIEYTTYETSGKQRTLSSHVTTTYDSLGRIVCKEAFTGFYVSNEALFNYSRVVKQTWEYDARGNIICLKAYKDKSKPFKVVRYEYIYDDHDNWIQCRRHEGESEDSMPVTQTLQRVICYY